MSFDVFIRKPVFASVLSLILLLVGLRAFVDLPVRQYPAIEPSVVNVKVTYPGASAPLMEGFITTPIESALSGVQGLDYMVSQNSQGVSSITLHFKLGYSIDKAMTDVTSQVNSVRGTLPKEIEDPVISKEDPNAEPTVWISFQNSKMSPEALTDYLVRVVKPQLAVLPGVGRTEIYGIRQYAMRIWLDPSKMAAFNVTAEDVQKALTSNNVQTAAGLIEGKWQEIDVKASTDLTTAAQFNKMVIRAEGDSLVRLRDVGRAELGSESKRVTAVADGKMTIIMGLAPQSTANPLDISKEVHKVMPNIQENLPPGVTMKIDWDSASFISASIRNVVDTVIEASIFVLIVIFLCLGSIRSVIIPLVTIPLSLIGVCIFMMALGYTINTITLLAWVLAIGLVVDDAIVVLENVHRHIELGKSPFEAALIGTREIAFAVIAMTLTLAAVFAPVGFLGGLTGKLFKEFAFTLAGTVILSGFVALTLSPMMCSKILKPHHGGEKQGFEAKVDRFFTALMERYKVMLDKVLTNKKGVTIAAAIIYATCYFFYLALDSELAPHEDEGYVMTIAMGPTSANLGYTEKYTQQIEKIFQKVPELNNYLMINGYPAINSAIGFLVLKPWSKRKRTVDEIIMSLYGPMMGIPGLRVFPFNASALPGAASRDPVQFVLKGVVSYKELDDAAQKLLADAHKNPRLANVDLDLKLDKAQINIVVDRDKASDMGIPTGVISNTLGMLMAQPTVTRFVMEGRSYKVIPQLEANFRENPAELNKIYVRNMQGGLVPFSNIVTLEETVGAKSLNHFQQLRSITLTATPVGGYTLGEALDYLKKEAKKILPQGIQFDYSGQSRQYIQASGAMAVTFGFALIFIFLVLAAQFESFRDPLIVMISVPLSISGALLIMLLTKCTLNIYTQIGLVMLIGLITKHGILIVEFANQLQEKGMAVKEAVFEAAALRLRPILMTTGAMILGAVPLVIASGAGAESRRQIGWVLVGGMSFGTLLTLFIIPVAYLLLSKVQQVHHENRSQHS